MISLHSQTEIRVIAKLLNVSCRGNQKPMKASNLITVICVCGVSKCPASSVGRAWDS